MKEAEDRYQDASLLPEGPHEALADDDLGVRTAQACCRAITAALIGIAGTAGFLPPSLAARISADLDLPEPPLSAKVLANDEIVIRLRKSIPADFDIAAALAATNGSGCILDALAAREDVAFELIEGLGGRLADMLSATLIDHYGLQPDMASYLAASARSEMLSRALEVTTPSRIEAFMVSLQDRGKLGGEAMLTYAGRRNPILFHAALGQAARLDAEMVSAFIEDGGERVLCRLLDRTDFIEPLKKAILSTFLAAR